MKKIALAGVAITVVVVIACATIGKDKTSPPANKIDTAKWQAKSPRLFNTQLGHIAESGAIMSASLSHLSESQVALVGTVTNQFGIRDDILDYIITTIPESNIGATISAIKLSQFDQQELLVDDPDAINKLSDKGGAAIDCLGTYLGMTPSTNFIHGYDKLLRNTPQRKAKHDEIENKLSGRIISSNYGFYYRSDKDTYESICARYIQQ